MHKQDIPEILAIPFRNQYSPNPMSPTHFIPTNPQTYHKDTLHITNPPHGEPRLRQDNNRTYATLKTPKFLQNNRYRLTNNKQYSIIIWQLEYKEYIGFGVKQRMGIV